MSQRVSLYVGRYGSQYGLRLRRRVVSSHTVPYPTENRVPSYGSVDSVSRIIPYRCVILNVYANLKCGDRTVSYDTRHDANGMTYDMPYRVNA